MSACWRRRVYLGEAGSALNQDTWLTLVERLRTLLYAYFERYDEVVDPPCCWMAIS